MKFSYISSLLLTGVLALATAQPRTVHAAHYKLFVLTGQSNSLGVTNGGEPDPTAGTDAADAKVLFAWHNVANASTSLGHSGLTLGTPTTTADFTTLRDQQGGYYTGSATHWGPEIEFARTLYRAGVRNFGVVKASRGGGGNSNWHKATGGHMYAHTTTTVARAVASLAPGDTYEIAGLLYLQGESDNSTEAAVAGTRFKELVDNLRTDLANAGNLHAVIGGIAAAGGTRDVVRANQAAIAAGTAYIDYYENLDQQTNLHDGLHFNRAAKITVGNRYAQAFLDAGVVSRHYGNLVFIGDSITQGGNGDHPSFRYQVFKNLATQGVPINPSAGYTFVGSISGAYLSSALTTPNVNGQAFENNHDGHWGWRAFWENGRVPLPTGRRSNNRGEGTILNWTGQASPQRYVADAGTVDFPDLTAAGTGVAHPYTPYTPDTAVIMIGINDLADGTSPPQTRDDIARMIDQLQSANPGISVFISQTLHTDQSAAMDTRVDTLNGLLPALAAAKTTAASSVWVIDTDNGFDPVTQTYDNVHPNAFGEATVGNRISGGLGIIAMPEAGTVGTPPPVIEKGTAGLTTRFEGNAIYDGAAFINGWADVTPAATTETLTGTELNRTHVNGAGAWLEGTASTLDAGTTTWTTGNDGNWTFETRMRVNASPNGFVLWLGVDTDLLLVQIYDNWTRNNAGTFNALHNNLDGNFHTWRVAHDRGNGKYHVWRDGERLTPVDGVGYDMGNNDNRLIIGDYTGGGFGDLYNVDIDYICYDLAGAYLPTGADADNDGMTDTWEYLYFQDVSAATPDGDDDDDHTSNLDEFTADTNPTDPGSVLRISTLLETNSTWNITVPATSPQRNYTLHQADDLGLPGPWSAVPGQGPSIGTDGDLVFTTSSGANKKHYVVEVSIP